MFPLPSPPPCSSFPISAPGPALDIARVAARRGPARPLRTIVLQEVHRSAARTSALLPPRTKAIRREPRVSCQSKWRLLQRCGEVMREMGGYLLAQVSPMPDDQRLADCRWTAGHQSGCCSAAHKSPASRPMPPQPRPRPRPHTRPGRRAVRGVLGPVRLLPSANLFTRAFPPCPTTVWSVWPACSCAGSS